MKILKMKTFKLCVILFCFCANAQPHFDSKESFEAAAQFVQKMRAFYDQENELSNLLLLAEEIDSAAGIDVSTRKNKIIASMVCINRNLIQNIKDLDKEITSQYLEISKINPNETRLALDFAALCLYLSLLELKILKLLDMVNAVVRAKGLLLKVADGGGDYFQLVEQLFELQGLGDMMRERAAVLVKYLRLCNCSAAQNDDKSIRRINCE